MNEEAPTKRVMIQFDGYPEAPDYDAHVPVIAINYRGGVSIPVGDLHLPDLSVIERAWRSLRDINVFERWLRIFIGPTRELENYVHQGSTYFAVASEDWIKEMGSDAETWKSAIEEHTEFEDYIEGDVFILVPQTLEVWVKLTNGYRWDGNTQYAVATEPDQLREEWADDPDESCIGGFYGKEWAVRAVAEHFPDHAGLIVDEDGDEIPQPPKESTC